MNEDLLLVLLMVYLVVFLLIRVKDHLLINELIDLSNSLCAILLLF